MPIPMATTTISVLEPTTAVDDYLEEHETYTVAESAIRAIITSPSPGQATPSGLRTVYVLNCDKCTISEGSVVRDEKSLIEYVVLSAEYRELIGYVQARVYRFRDQ